MKQDTGESKQVKNICQILKLMFNMYKYINIHVNNYLYFFY